MLDGLRPMMQLVVTNGTAKDLDGSGDVRGKTGEAEFDGGSHAWFAGYRGDMAFAALIVGGGSSEYAVRMLKGMFDSCRPTTWPEQPAPRRRRLRRASAVPLEAGMTGIDHRRSAMRISDADRNGTLRRLHNAVALGLIDIDEFEERSALVSQARLHSDLDALVGDLPGPGAIVTSATDRVELRGVLGSLKRQGEWIVPTRLALHRRMGSVDLDLTRARFAGPMVVIELDMKFGGLDLRLPDGASASIDDVEVIVGSAHDHRKDAPAEGTPHVILTGSGVRSVDIRGPRSRPVRLPRLCGRRWALPERLVGHAVALLVRAHLLAHLRRIQTGVRPAVSAATAVAGMGGQELAHPLLGDGLQLAAERGVQRPDRRERVAHEIGELHVDHLAAAPASRAASCRARSPTTISSQDCAAHSAMMVSSDAIRRR